jgi:alpha-N-acetylglucosaminidase
VQAVGGSVDQRLALAAEADKAQHKEVAEQNAARAIIWLNRMDALMNLRPGRQLESWTAAACSWAQSYDEAAY